MKPIENINRSTAAQPNNAGTSVVNSRGSAAIADRQPWDVDLKLLIVLSLSVNLFVGQDEEIERGSLFYWFIVGPAMLLPLLRLRRMVIWLANEGRLLALFGLTACVWHLIRGDIAVVLQLILLVQVTTWIMSETFRLDIVFLVRLFTALVVGGGAVQLFGRAIGIENEWGLLPGQTISERAAWADIWRVSFFPNIANTAVLSLAMFLLMTRDVDAVRRHPAVFFLVVYFLVFSFVRTVLIGVGLYILLRFVFWWLRPLSPKRLLVIAIATILAVHGAIVVSPLFLSGMDSDVISRLFLRGQLDLGTVEIEEQVYRPWVWMQHTMLFWNSPVLMGLGSYEFGRTVSELLTLTSQFDTGSTSFLTGLLAKYGLPSFAYFAFLLSGLLRTARRKDEWGCAVYPVIVLVMFSWGTVFHPANAFYALFLLMLMRGSASIQRG